MADRPRPGAGGATTSSPRCPMTPPNPRQPPPSDEDRLEEVVRRFEDSWRHGPRPRIDDFLAPGDPLRFSLLVELVHVDLELRLKSGDPARAEDYLARHPELAGDRAAVMGLITAEYELRCRQEANLSLN